MKLNGKDITLPYTLVEDDCLSINSEIPNNPYFTYTANELGTL